jgi:hypothetical protein
VSRTCVFASAKVFFSKDQFVKLSANPHSAAFREHHKQDNIIFHSLVHIYFLFIFKPCLAIIVPAINKRMLTKMQAWPVPINFGRCNAYSRHSQQVPEIAGKHPNPPILLRLGKAIDKFK